MANIITIKRGLKANITGVELLQGELAITTDTHELYTGSSTGAPVLIKGDASASSEADKLSTARAIGISGDASGSANFDGSADIDIAVALANSGVTAGTYTKVTVDAKGRVTAGNTLSTADLPTISVVDIDGLSDALAAKADAATTLAGYGITNAYTKTEVDTALSGKVDTESGKGLSSNDYTDAEQTKLAGIATGAQVNVIESIKKNGTALTITDKEVDISVPTTLADLDANAASIVHDASYSHIDNNFTDALKTKLEGVETGAEVNIIEDVKVNGTSLTVTNKSVDVTIPSAAEYTLEEVTATTGYAKSYQLKKDSTYIGDKINIPADLVVKSGEVKTVTTADVPYSGAQVGDKYIDLELNDSTKDHIYIPVKDLVDVYTEGNGIDVSSGNVISIKFNSASQNGLSADASGLALATATTSAAGAMSSTDKTKLDGVATGAQVNTIEVIRVNNVAETPDANKAIDLTIPTKTSDLTNDANFVADASYVHTDNNYTSAEVTKLASITAGAQANLIDSISVNNVAQTIDANKNVNIAVPTKTSDLTNDSNFITTTATIDGGTF